jgi:hypothetical protein
MGVVGSHDRRSHHLHPERASRAPASADLRL